MHVESILSVYLSIHHRSFHVPSRPRSVETPEEKYLEEAALELAQDSGMGSLQVSMGGCPPWVVTWNTQIHEKSKTFMF